MESIRIHVYVKQWDDCFVIDWFIPFSLYVTILHLFTFGITGANDGVCHEQPPSLKTLASFTRILICC